MNYTACVLTDYNATRSVIGGADVVVHLAAIPNLQNDPPERVLAVNTVSSFNVLEAVRYNGIRRVVYGCSESSSGFGIHYVNLKPLYLPLDEEHPCWPHETYSVSKRFGVEMLARNTRAYGFEGVSLRYTWVWTERDDQAVRGLVPRYRAGQWSSASWFGAYIASHDVAQTVTLACTYDFPSEAQDKFEPFCLSAADTFYPVPTLQVLEGIYSELQPAAGGRLLSFRFWRQFCEIEAVAAVKIAPCNRYQTIDVVRAAADSGRIADIALYNGNEDHIIGDMLTTCRFDGAPKVSITGGLLRQWAVWTSPAVRYFAKCRKVRGAHPLPAELLTLDTHVTDANAALFDAASGFKGCIAGIQCVLA